jgi:hypothetical protein
MKKLRRGTAKRGAILQQSLKGGANGGLVFYTEPFEFR